MPHNLLRGHLRAGVNHNHDQPAHLKVKEDLKEWAESTSYEVWHAPNPVEDTPVYDEPRTHRTPYYTRSRARTRWTRIRQASVLPLQFKNSNRTQIRTKPGVRCAGDPLLPGQGV